MTIYVKTILFGPTSGGKKVPPEKVDQNVNEALEIIQREAGKIIDVKIALTPMTPGNHLSTFVIIYEAPKPIS
jgi:hypothetical protein